MNVDPYLIVNGDVSLSARIYREPENLLVRQPAVIVTGSWLTVKEQMADRYARALAARGFTVFTFDFAGFGESGGGPRQAELPARKIADIKAAAEHVSTLSFVHPRQVGYLAICASAQYALAAIAAGAPISAFASVAGWFHDMESVAPFYGGAAGVDLRVGRGREALQDYLSTGSVRTVPAYEDGNDRAGMSLPLDYYADADRGAVPAWTNQMAELSWHYWLTFDGLSAASAVSTPSLFVHGDDCVLPDNVRRIGKTLSGPTEMVWSDGGQTDFYDQPAQVDLAVDAATTHFKRTLSA
ncbi:alpha/beta hydrolase [Fodinicola feengrottensis]|uniref:AB hydrolase-1 domain-containing protein n=1 Tax=Fodinicola feengrottensis TaxID=435914 RepID=A0ABN2IZL9_9ACTN|nr:alpha/beta hydrolase [Fodinicola feengrottensis]